MLHERTGSVTFFGRCGVDPFCHHLGSLVYHQAVAPDEVAAGLITFVIDGSFSSSPLRAPKPAAFVTAVNRAHSRHIFDAWTKPPLAKMYLGSAWLAAANNAAKFGARAQRAKLLEAPVEHKMRSSSAR